jgi:hypothetical protein
MTPSQLIELTEAKELMQSGRYREALGKLTWLGNRLPQDPEIDSLIRECRSHEGERVNQPPTRKPQESKPQEVTIVFKSASNMALVLFIVITLSIVAAWYIIFYVFNFTLRIRPAEIQFFLGWLGLL